jgi:hypothetical protein
VAGMAVPFPANEVKIHFLLSFLFFSSHPSYFDIFIFSYVHLFIFSPFHICICSYFENTSRFYSVGGFRTMFHRTTGCIKWSMDLSMWMSVGKRVCVYMCICVSVYVLWGWRLEVWDWRLKIGDWRLEVWGVRCGSGWHWVVVGRAVWQVRFPASEMGLHFFVLFPILFFFCIIFLYFNLFICSDVHMFILLYFYIFRFSHFHIFKIHRTSIVWVASGRCFIEQQCV